MFLKKEMFTGNHWQEYNRLRQETKSSDFKYKAKLTFTDVFLYRQKMKMFTINILNTA